MSKFTDNDIRQYDNVPVDVAADYLGVFPERLRTAFKQGKLPNVGVAILTSGNKTMFMISPGGLINWKRGTVPLQGG